MQLPPVAATTVGSFPRPGWLAETRKSEVVFRLEGDLLRDAQDDATLLVLRQQEDVGLDLLTDGEQRRLHFIFHVLGHMDGFDLENRHLKAIRGRDVATNMVPRVVGRVRRRTPAVVDHVVPGLPQHRRALLPQVLVELQFHCERDSGIPT
jgi:5-methyltetrahydropteroyltriglutamate--homocysteine methyltransferase